MLILLIPLLWLAAMVLFAAVCRTAALGDATRAQAAERDARAAAAIDGLLVRDAAPGWAPQEQERSVAPRARITAYGVR